MAVRQINTADYDYAMMLETINKSYKGKADITISEYATTAAPDVKVGSVWEDNGAIFILETADMTPTGYAAVASSTTFYLYYDESASVFIYLSTAPTWSDALQGWYNGNDRAFFSMYKDSTDTYYENKYMLKPPTFSNIPNTITTLTAGTTWVVPNDVYRIKATIVGAGGGGAGASLVDGSTGGTTTWDGTSVTGGPGGYGFRVTNGRVGGAGLRSGNGGMAGMASGSGTGSGTDGQGGDIAIILSTVTPGETITYAIGAGGAGGAGVGAGGAGGRGEIILEY